MFEQALQGDAGDSLALLGKSGILSNAYMAGGTAAALQLGHRISVDFDFFISETFEPREFAEQISNVDTFTEETAERGTVTGVFRGVKFSLFMYNYPLLFEPRPYKDLRIADIRDLAAMKVDAIAGRGAKRDFIDLFYICRSGHSISEVLDFYNRKYETLVSNRIHLLKSLIYFEDAEQDEMPRMFKEASWEDIKSFFKTEIKKIAG
ncbi:nucleotidyl transferase AbiEii/AbiGii toxin family protein [Planctomycetota bacterium]